MFRRNLASNGLLELMNRNVGYNYYVKLLYSLAFVPTIKLLKPMKPFVVKPYLLTLRGEEWYKDYKAQIDDYLVYILKEIG